MKPSYRFFQNKACQYYPCHQAPSEAEFNCLFCYCPLYFLGDTCGGRFRYSASGIKNCQDCHLPHQPDYYEVILAKIKQANQTGC